MNRAEFFFNLNSSNCMALKEKNTYRIIIMHYFHHAKNSEIKMNADFCFD